MRINIEKLRSDLCDYFGTAMSGTFPQAIMEYEEIENASESELISIAERNGFDIENYIVDY